MREYFKSDKKKREEAKRKKKEEKRNKKLNKKNEQLSGSETPEAPPEVNPENLS